MILSTRRKDTKTQYSLTIKCMIFSVKYHKLNIDQQRIKISFK